MYYHLRSTVKRERFFAQIYFSNETVSQTTVSTGPMKMFRLEHETMNVCQRNVARFGHVECRFDKRHFSGFCIKVCCHCDFRKMEALKVNKFGQTYRTGTQAAQVIVVKLLFLKSLWERSARETWHSYRRHLLLHNDRVSLRERWLSPFSIRRCWNWGQLFLLHLL